MKTTHKGLFKTYIFRLSCMAVGLGSTLTACDEKELLNPLPETSVQADLVFSTPSRVLGQVNGLYKSLKHGNFLGGRYPMLSDIRGEEFLNRLNNIFTGYDAWNHTINSGSNDALTTWSSAYAAINLSNLLIDGLAANPDVVSAEIKAQYIAEAKFVRALSYYSLITFYGQPYVKDGGASSGIPLRLSGQMTSANNSLPSSTVAEIYTQILKDLDEAEASLPLTYSSALLNTTRAHKNTAIALKTRVYLTMGMNDRVIQEAQKIVPEAAPFRSATGVAHQLQPSILTVFRSDYTTTESILSMPMTALDYVSGQSSLGYEFNTNQEYSMNPMGIFGDPTWRSTDARKTMFRTNTSGTYLTKYMHPTFLDYVPVLRYSEVLLNYAEAAAKSGNLAKGAELLTAVRQRSDAGYSFPASAISSGEALVNTILIERRIEFLGEGLRSNDLLRNLLPIPSKGTAPSISPGQPEYIFPIPNAEISANNDL
ncbi:SusD-like starch-binding protein associating with outer membrane [Arcticibacter pallidicorallinus]|uniref:SusD-like starch-binding protein associating with outer membrane n=1 Tax=Arcticibacter pallidicorallinus TaxID=1259464 RepID=A0A2T0U183_9SPHI|nr:RagB/SusD family nutrient uptake outer membrane protein [Arcticibacter pallidicorallinus]PRY51598.1 SusD-like starch-binding protein associating with outer membrane [Arcticibacter pallidicorallinus]